MSKKNKARATAKAEAPAKTTARTAKAAPPKAATEAGTKRSCLDAAAQVLKTAGEPLNCKAMINAIFAAKLWHSDAPTPAATLSSAILREIKTKGSDARFKKTDRGLFSYNGGK